MGAGDKLARKSKFNLGIKSGALKKVLIAKKSDQYFIELEMVKIKKTKRLVIPGSDKYQTLQLHYHFQTKKKTPSYPIQSNGSLKFKYSKLQIEITKEQYLNTTSLYLWFEPVGYASLYNPDDAESFSLGICVVDLSKIKKQVKDGKKIIPTKLYPTISVVQYIDDEMHINAVSEVTTKIAALNKKANFIYRTGLQQAATKAGLSQIELSFSAKTLKDIVFNVFSGRSYRRFKYDEVLYKMIGNKNYDLIKRDLLRYPKSYEHKTLILTFDHYLKLKGEALNLWAGKVHTRDNSTVLKRIKTLALDLSFPGTPNWDHKPYIGAIWAHKNRLGNVNYWIYYDVWSNMHYGYVGRKAGFNWDELELGSNAQQKNDHDEDDGDRDKESMRAGYDMQKPDINKILKILKMNKSKWGGIKASDRAQ